ncbi:dihydropteroate synthase [Streptomyces sp. NRRL F-5065]|uniref:dihydropteroate synthase n=1 Tax=Streptomyces sp. NRRL F-5065 TaxID=1463855 RepID=UPI00068B932F|nr:dihydropteroate synthase [Streptomyces sp. NRRL F-5065]
MLPVAAEPAAAGVRVGVDTTRPVDAPVGAGAALVNVGGGPADPAMARVPARAGAPRAPGHRCGAGRTVYAGAVHGDVAAEARTELPSRADAADAAVAAGVDAGRLILAPCPCFATPADHDGVLLSPPGHPGPARTAGAAGPLPQAVARPVGDRRRGPVHGRGAGRGVRVHDVDAVPVPSAAGRAAA